MTIDETMAQLIAQVEGEAAEGRALVRSPADNPICDIAYDAAVPCVAITWKRYATSAQLRFIADSVIALALRHNEAKFSGPT